MARRAHWLLAALGLLMLGLAAQVTSIDRAEPEKALGTEKGAGDLIPAGAWTVQTGAGGWGNKELQTYTEDAVRFGVDGSITITAREIPNGTASRYTSGRVTTVGRWSFVEGTVTARIRLPDGQGLLPAFWLLGDDLATVGWPACGEIDVVETPNTTARSVHSIHGPQSADPTNGWRVNLGVDHSPPLSGGFHDYSLVRTRERIVILVDGVTVLDRNPSDLGFGHRWVFDQPFHLVVSLAVGGVWPGDPDESTPATATLEVAWIRFGNQVEFPAGAGAGS